MINAESIVRSSKLPDVGVTIFTVMSRLALERSAINLSQGFPDFDCDPALIDLVSAAMRSGHNQYAPMSGVAALLEEIARKMERLYGARYDPGSEITVTSGATEALFSTITALVRAGDEVVLFEPAYDAYVPAVQLNGGTPVFVTLRYPDYAIDWDEVRRAISPRTRLIVVNSPHNPTGMVLDAADIVQLEAIVERSGVILLADEVYEHIIFDGRRHESLSRHPALRARACVVSSFGKTFHTTGWKIGYVAAPAALTTEIQRVHQFVTFASSTPVQHAYAAFMRGRDSYDDVTRFYQEKRDRFLALTQGSRFRPIPCHGTFFQLLDYSGITAEQDSAFALRLLEEHGVASIPTSPFLYRSQSPPVLRFCFAKKDETLQKAADRLKRV
jgi:methionine aminotransferase